jgi:DNA-binding transcriptional regulator GbsR (MarR family)
MMDSNEIREIEKRIFNTFSELARSMGFSPIHGNIIGSLIVGGGSLSLQEIAKRTGYSISMISLSMDLLEILGIVKKVKKLRDRKLYIELNGDILESLKKIFLIRVKKGISDSLLEFEQNKEKLLKLQGKNKNDVLKAIDTLEKEIKRLDKYVSLLSGIKLP